MASVSPAERDIEEGIAPWDGRRVPMTLIGGYLGSGKTTILNDLLRKTERPIAVLVNDIGEINIDVRLLTKRSSDTMELTDGCVCCSMKEGLGAALAELRARPQPPDHVIIELSGVADPTQVLPWSNSDGFRLDGVIVLADATGVTQQLNDERLRPLLERQITPADLVVISKSELVTSDEREAARQAVLRISPDMPVVDDLDGTVASTLLDLGTRRARDATAIPPPTLLDPHQTELYQLPRPTTSAALMELIEALPSDVVRAKGIAEGPDDSRLLIQVVGRRRRVMPLPRAEDQDPTDLVVIRL